MHDTSFSDYVLECPWCAFIKSQSDVGGLHSMSINPTHTRRRTILWYKGWKLLQQMQPMGRLPRLGDLTDTFCRQTTQVLLCESCLYTRWPAQALLQPQVLVNHAHNAGLCVWPKQYHADTESPSCSSHWCTAVGMVCCVLGHAVGWL